MINIKYIYFLFFFILLIILFSILIYYYLNNNNNIKFEKFENSSPAPLYDPTTYDINKNTSNFDKEYLDYILNNSYSLIPSTNEFTKPLNINPVISIATETNLLNKLIKENDIMKNNNNYEKEKLEIIQKELLKIKEDIKNKEQEKLQLSKEISNMDNMRYISNTIISIIIKNIDNIIKKEQELKNYEKDLNNKKEKIEKLLLQPIPKIPPVIIKEEQIKPIKDKLKDLENIINKLDNKIPNNICNNLNMPIPKKEDFTYNLNQSYNSSYLWCMCNDNNKNSSNCIDYFNCNNNYLKNKDKSSLLTDDLNLYMKCINKFDNFPKYLHTNIKNNTI